MKNSLKIRENSYPELKSNCYCSRKCRYIAGGAIGVPLVVALSLVLAVIIKTETTENPFKRMDLTQGGPVTFMPDDESSMRTRAERLAKAISFKTFKVAEDSENLELQRINQFIERAFPELHNKDYITCDQVNGFSRLYRIEGTESRTTNPYLLTAHLDVVPEGDRQQWSRDPFTSGITDDGIIFGRGAIDDKHSVFGILEALNYKITQGKRPRRTFYLAFGHDEEVGGNEGAALLSRALEKKLHEHGEKLDFLLDEGMFLLDGMVPGVKEPLIYLGVTEKGWAMLDLVVTGEQVHSSIPPKESTIGILSKALYKLETNRMPSRFGKGPETDTLRYAAPHASYFYRMVFSNMWLFGDIIASIFGSDSESDSIQRTTTAITIVEAGDTANVVPGYAKARVNHRIHPVDNKDVMLKHDAKVINDDRVKIELVDDFPALPISPYTSDSLPFQIICNSAMDVFPNANPVPGLMVANTDTIHYMNLTEKIYRFTPVILDEIGLSMFHGIDEQISITDYNNVVQFYYRLMTNADFDVQTM